LTPRQFSTISFDINELRTAADQPSSTTITSRTSPADTAADNNRINYITKTLRSHQPRQRPHHKALQAQQEIQNWIAANRKIAPYKAEEKLSQLWAEQVELMECEMHPPVLVTTDTINLVLQAWTYSDAGVKGAVRAERLLHWMEGLGYSGSGLEPTMNEQSAEETVMYPVPDYRSYALVIEAWSRAAEYESSRASTSNEEAMKIGFECARKCEDLLMHMQKMHEVRLDSQDVGEDIQPDTNVFHHVLNAWGNIRGTKATAMRATRILDLMQELHHYQSMNADTWQGVGVSKVQPSLVTYKALLRAWANTGTAEGADQAELILRHLLSISKAGNIGVEIYPDAECFHVVMKAHADSVRKRRKGSSENAAERARQMVALLDWMELLASRKAHKNLKPTRETYRIVMSAWAWSRDVEAPKEAESVLFRMISASQLSDVEDAVDIILGEKKLSSKGKKNKVCEYPETRDFNTVINCAAFARGIGDVTTELNDDELVAQLQSERKEVFSIAEGVFDSLLKSEHAQPDSDTFLGMMRACQSLLPDNEVRDERVVELFRLAYQTPSPEQTSSYKPVTTYTEKLQAPKGGGCVDANVLRQLRLALPSTEEYIRVREEWEEYRRKNSEL
jgi:hypothetical protein